MSPELLARYRLKGSVGEGTYGKVYKAKRLRSTGSELIEEPGFIAIKTIKPSQNEVERPSVTSIATLREISLLRELKHDNIVNLIDVVIDNKERDVALVMDFADWTLDNVKSDHRARQKQVPEYCATTMMYQCLKGLEYMHESWVLHRDLKPQNILIVGEGPKRGTLQLADLGLARIFHYPLKAFGAVDKTVVTLWYRAPEILLGACHYTSAVDIWSMGCIFAELFFAHNPHAPPALFAGKPQDEKSFEEDQCKEVFKVLGMPNVADWPEVTQLTNFAKMEELRARSPQISSSSRLPQRIGALTLQPGAAQHKAFMDLLASMLELNPKKRVSATQALQHPFFQSFFKRYPEHHLRNALDDPFEDHSIVPRRNFPKVEMKPLSQDELDAIRDAEGLHLKRNSTTAGISSSSASHPNKRSKHY